MLRGVEPFQLYPGCMNELERQEVKEEEEEKEIRRSKRRRRRSRRRMTEW
jgi:predicted nucleic acid-binding Zn ribbon protein